jgi:hypothetical protein
LALHSVERGLVDVVRDPAASPAVGPRGSIWCAAQPLDASALAWQRLHPEAGWRYDALGMRLEREMAVHSRFALTATYVAATSRRANVALEQPASGVEPSETALEAFEAAAVALAATGIQAWVGVRSRRPAGSFIEQTLTMQRLAARVGASAALDPHAGRSAGGWLAIAIAHTPPNLSLAVAEDPDADRVLRAEARIASSEAWIARGVEELRAVQRVDDEWNSVPPRCLRVPAPVAAATRAAALPVRTGGAAAAWGRHSFGLARLVGTYLTACAEPDPWFGVTRETLLDLLADSLAQAAQFDAPSGASDGGFRAPCI